jgi:hypothetical protein
MIGYLWRRVEVLGPVVMLGAFILTGVAFWQLSVVVQRIQRDEVTIAALQRADHAAIAHHAALLREVRADEARICAAARESGDTPIIRILCP